MKISTQWLKDWVDIDVDPSTLAERLTLAGLEVGDVARAAPRLDGVAVARVAATVPHPDAERLTVCEIDAAGDAPVTVVCGAPNARPGLVVAYAQPGTELPDGRVIENAVIRDVASAGMLCSAAELGLGDDAAGLLELPVDAPIGRTLASYLDLDDVVLDVELTPNRGDCLSVLGIAREVAALTGNPLHAPAIAAVAASIDDTLAINLDESHGCPRYAGRVIRDVDAGATTPVWMSERLRRAGVRPINAIVDVTNYVMLELGQPMHGFDLDRLDGGILVRNAAAGETLELLDGQTVELDEHTLVIADEKRAVALAGVMGGLATGVERSSTSVFLESAYFDPITLAGVARRYRLHTDASHRFERGVDAGGQERAIERATALIIEICGGRPGPVVVTEDARELPVRAPIALRLGEIPRLLGISVAADRVAAILRALECDVQQRPDATALDVTPPGFRFDLAVEADLLEEIARIQGYDNIPSTLPQTALRIADTTMRRDRDEIVRELLITSGYNEAITYSFIDPASATAVAPDARTHVLENPISADLAVMRPSIWPGLLKAAIYNLNRRADDVRLFELGMVFEATAGGLVQRHVAAGIAIGRAAPEQWGQTSRKIDFFDVKQHVDNVLEALGQAAGVWRPAREPALHPGQAATCVVAGETLATLGRIDPRVARALDLDADALLFEIDLERLSRPAPARFRPLSKFPPVRRDLSLVVDRTVPAGAILEAARAAAGTLLRDLQLFDEYEGQGIDSDKKSLTIGLIFQALSSTLTDQEIEETMERVLQQLQSDFGGTLRT